MGKILKLDDRLSNMIAAGEVVERPASVCKELVENSMDAGSNKISVSLIDSGVKQIIVTDNGSGMSKEDALMAFSRHATSKIKNEYDLFRIKSLGFRGEAIPSIASVSKMSLQTSEGEEGYEVIYEAGKKVNDNYKACNKGTSIKVSDLFYNTPARLKYLKSLPIELSQITNLMMKFSLSRPDISFSLSNNNKEIFSVSGNNDIIRLFGEIYGYEVAKSILNDSYKSVGYNIRLYICKSNVSRSNKNEITLIVNNRYVKSKKITDALIEAYHTYIPINRYPIALIYLDLDPLLLDVNIHPSKAIIKISNEDEISNKISQMVKSLLNQTNMIPNIEEKKEYKKESIFENYFKEPNNYLNEEVKYNNEIKYNTNLNIEDFDEPIIKDIEEPIKDIEIKKIPYLEYVGQVHGTYLIFQNEEGMYLIDQHAACERINYEKYYNILSNPSNVTTPLLIPYEIQFNPLEMNFIETNLSKLENIGIIMTQRDNKSYYIREVPYWIEFNQIEDIIRLMISSFMKDDEINIIKYRDKISKQIACKDSIKANSYVSKDEAMLLVENLNKCNNPYTCPHGRPSIIKFTSKELEKLFLRVV